MPRLFPFDVVAALPFFSSTSILTWTGFPRRDSPERHSLEWWPLRL